MLHLVHQGALKADKIGGQCVIENLTASIVEHFVTERPTAQHGEQIFITRALPEKACAGGDDDFVALERLYERELVRREVAQRFARTQWTLRARRNARLAWINHCYCVPPTRGLSSLVCLFLMTAEAI